MIMSRSVIRAKRGHNNDVVQMLKGIMGNMKQAAGDRLKGYRIYSNYTGDNSLIILEEEYESVADWDVSFQNLSTTDAYEVDFDKYWELFTSWERDFWVVEAEG